MKESREYGDMGDESKTEMKLKLNLKDENNLKG